MRGCLFLKSQLHAVNGAFHYNEIQKSEEISRTILRIFQHIAFTSKVEAIFNSVKQES